MLFRKWEETRKKGVVHFILVYGVFVWGILAMGVLVPLLSALIENGLHVSAYSFEWKELFLRVVIFGLSGALLGLSSWHSAESRYEEEQKK